MSETRSIGEILRDAEAGRLDRVFAEEREPYDFIATTRRLFDLLDERGIDYVLVGGLAMLQYVEGRNTRDIDLIVAPSFTHDIPEVALASEDRDFGRGDFSGVQIDLLKASNPVFQLVRSRFAQPMQFGSRRVLTATAEGLFLLKCYALPSLYRQGEFVRSDIYEGDIRALLRAREFDDHALIGLLAPHMLATDIAAIRDVVSDQRGLIASSIERREELGPESKIQNPK